MCVCSAFVSCVMADPLPAIIDCGMSSVDLAMFVLTRMLF